MVIKHITRVAFLAAFATLASIPIVQAQNLSQGLAQKFSDGFTGDAGTALRQERRTIESWAAQFLDTHPKATTDELAAGITELFGDLKVEVVQLDTDVHLIAASDGPAGSVFIMGRGKRNRFAPLWRISDGVGKAAKEFPMVAAWSIERAKLGCRKAHSPAAAIGCGPVAATSIGRLPDGKDGAKRFYVDAAYAQLDDAMVAGQTTLWRWQAGMATPILGGTYAYNPDQDPHLLVEATALHIHDRAHYKSFADCGSCAGRVMDWTIRVLPDRVVDGGRTSLEPELDLADTLFRRLLDRKPVADIADPAVVAMVTPMIDAARQYAAETRTPLSLGDLEEAKVTAEDVAHALCLATDQGGPYEFLIDTSTSRWRFISARAATNCGR
ncbi:MAG TPA: hypothetical protein VL574_06155 [Stellaceae bacterium]|jgi:hypothetical protein|nr:hypothetical protein [Stellaceae bacterium]